MSPEPVSTGVAAVDTLVVWALVVSASAAGLALLVRLLRGMRNLAMVMENFAEDWHGETGRPGVPRRAGVMERLDGIETRLEGVERRLGEGPQGGRPPIRAVP